MLVLDVAVAVVLVSNAVHVVVNLLGGRIVVGPVRVGGETEGIVVGGDVAFASGIAVLFTQYFAKL